MIRSGCSKVSYIQLKYCEVVYLIIGLDTEWDFMITKPSRLPWMKKRSLLVSLDKTRVSDTRNFNIVLSGCYLGLEMKIDEMF